MCTSPFSDRLWQAASSISASISKHPFLLELQDGTLPVEKFRFYIKQDYLYLGVFGRAAAAALAMAPDDETARKLLLRVSTPVERPLHKDLFDQLGITSDEISRIAPAPHQSGLHEPHRGLHGPRRPGFRSRCPPPLPSHLPRGRQDPSGPTTSHLPRVAIYLRGRYP